MILSAVRDASPDAQSAVQNTNETESRNPEAGRQNKRSIGVFGESPGDVCRMTVQGEL